uniref:Putative secreted protein n=1 Tax=Anopheles darlingi TaxID=43151 RepID=A0A2M4DA82_ANODA
MLIMGSIRHHVWLWLWLRLLLLSLVVVVLLLFVLGGGHFAQYGRGCESEWCWRGYLPRLRLFGGRGGTRGQQWHACSTNLRLHVHGRSRRRHTFASTAVR